MKSRNWKGSENDPLFGDTPIEELRTVIHVKALVAGRRHLVHEHGLEVAQVDTGAVELTELHYRAHGIVDPEPINRQSMPWAIVSLPHAADTAEVGEGAAEGGESVPSGRQVADQVQEATSNSEQPMDPGLRLVHDVFEQLQIDSEWSLWEGRGFTWWPHQRAQRVWADDSVKDDGLTVSLVHAEAEMFVGAERSKVAPRGLDALLGVASRDLSVSGFVRRGDRVALHASAFVHEENQQWMSRTFQMSALIQVVNAARGPGAIAETLGLVPAASAHPTSGDRPDPDEMLDALDDLPASDTKWGTENEYSAVVEALGGHGLLASGGGLGLTVEFPFGSRGGPAVAGGESNLLSVSSEPNGSLGEGLRMNLRLRRWPTDGDLQLFPPELNRLESEGGSRAHLIGSWAIDLDPDSVPFFTCWLPTVVERPGLLMNLVLAMGVRSNWVATLMPDAAK